MDNKAFRTFSEYMKNEDNPLTASMEDYLEMIYRLSIDKGFTRIHDLSEALNVHPPSATRMVQRLGELDLLLYEKYGVIVLKDEGKKLGAFLLKRHKTVESFLRILGISEDKILIETEKVEHTLSNQSIKCFDKYIAFIKDNPDIAVRFNEYMGKKRK
ncbi:transcriptional regulator MntR [Clostridium manihotivorum]|uniref:Manganese transport regulator n=1 Tax=Clostridium manihotivorum TaxID=2320868 RepID=A0A3R5QXZ4_9CLOT|nr:transcriptional regulator MntR [Clostridium manihotivorum]QAA34874.1 transcriptional regulator MntR [Clostridium manihotivorum]